jgi:hypothetical protein
MEPNHSYAYVLYQEYGEYESYCMKVKGIFLSLDGAVRGLIYSATNTNSEDECVKSIHLLDKPDVRNFGKFLIGKFVLGARIEIDEDTWKGQWLYQLIPKSRFEISSEDYEYKDNFYRKNYGTTEGFYVCHSKRKYVSVTCISNFSDYNIVPCAYCNKHDVTFSYNLEFLDKFNNEWKLKFDTK